MGDGLGAGDNTRAALMTRGLAEITRLGVAMGGRAETFAGLAGMGDLIATCTSALSRNRHVGVELGKIGRAHVCTPVTNAQLVYCLLLENNKNNNYHTYSHYFCNRLHYSS